MAELWFDPAASDELTRLEQDPTRQHLLGSVNRALDQLENDPSDSWVRERLFLNTDPRLWYVGVRGDGEEWVVLWNPHPETDEAIVVQYLGPASFA